MPQFIIKGNIVKNGASKAVTMLTSMAGIERSPILMIFYNTDILK